MELISMNGRSNNQRQRKNQESFQKIIVRCNALQRPVYEHEVCSKYMIKTEATAQKICKNCKYSF
jgi:hypothetical protein